MTSDKTAILGGLIILAGGLSLAFYASTNALALSQSRAKIVTKYISLSQKALKQNKLREAEKFAIKALTTDPQNKLAITAFKKVELAGYAPVTSGKSAIESNSATDKTKPSATESAPKQPQAPAPEEEAEEEMGCI